MRPGGTIMLKSARKGSIDPDISLLVVDVITLLGSRCGPFAPALRLLERRLVDVESLITAEYSLDDGLAALAHAGQPGVLKVLLRP